MACCVEFSSLVFTISLPHADQKSCHNELIETAEVVFFCPVPLNNTDALAIPLISSFTKGLVHSLPALLLFPTLQLCLSCSAHDRPYRTISPQSLYEIRTNQAIQQLTVPVMLHLITGAKEEALSTNYPVRKIAQLHITALLLTLTME